VGPRAGLDDVAPKGLELRPLQPISRGTWCEVSALGLSGIVYVDREPHPEFECVKFAQETLENKI
jgi:hypothetical protein